MSTAFVSPFARASYPNLVTARAVNKGDDPKFGMVLIFEEGTDLTVVKSKIVEAGREFFKDEFETLLNHPKFKFPLHDDWKDKNYPEGSVYLNCYSPSKPQVVSRYADPATGKPRRLTDEEILKMIYPGAIVRASIRFYGFDKKGKGIGVGLNNVQFIGDAPRLDGRKNAEDEFDAEEQDTADIEVEAPAKAAKSEAPAPRSRTRGKSSATDLSDML